MWAPSIPYLCMFFEALLLLRAWRKRTLARFPIFYSYIAFVLLQSVLRTIVRLEYSQDSKPYSLTFWSTEFMGVFVGCSIFFEFYKIALAGFPGAGKLARNALLFVFALTIGKVLVTAAHLSAGLSGELIIQLVRDMRFVQLAAIVTLLALFFLYAIPTGRNLLGIVLGYGIFIAVSVLNLVFLDRFRGEALFAARAIQSSSYLFALCVWTVALWSYRPAVAPRLANPAVAYPILHGATSERLADTRVAVHGALDN